MNRVTINESTSSQLREVSQPAVLVDQSGKLLGHFVPTCAVDAAIVCPYSDEELLRMRNETGGRPLREIWDALSDK